MAGMPRLENASIDLRAHREHMRVDLMDALDSVSVANGSRGGKALVLDPSLSGPLGMIAEVREFKRGLEAGTWVVPWLRIVL